MLAHHQSEVLNNNKKTIQYMEKLLHVHRPLFLFIMRVAIIPIFIVVTCTGVVLATESKGQEALKKKISIEVKNQEMQVLLSKLEEVAGIRFIYSPEVIPVHKKVSIQANNDALGEVLQKVLAPHRILFEAVENQIVLRKQEEAEPEANAADRILTGRIVDETNTPLPGVSVLIKGSTIGTTTDADGNYSLNIPSDHEGGLLVITFIGYATQEITIDTRTVIDIQMAPDIQSLQEVVVVGASLKEKDLTGAVVSVSEKTLSERPVTSVNEALQGRAAGVFIQNNPEPGGNATIRVRGNNSMQFGASPIYVVDGIVMERDFNMINLNDVASINVLKDASSTALYGSRGANGVVIITTKKGKSGEGKVSYDGWFGVQEFANRPPTLGARDILDLRIAAFEDSSIGRDFFDANPTATRQDFINYLSQPGGRIADYETETYANGKSYDWVDEITRSAFQQNHSLSFSGGTDKGSYYVSFGYADQEGLVQSSGYKRYTGRVNAEQNMKKWLKIGTNTSFTRSEEDLVDGKVFGVASGANPLLPFYHDSLKLAWGNNWDVNMENPFKSLTIDKDRSKNRIFTSNYISINPVKNLTLRTNFTIDLIDQEYYEYTPSGIQQAIRDSFRGRAVHNLDHVLNYQWDNSITYEKQFDRHLVSALIGTSMSRNQFKYTNLVARDFPTDDFGYNNLGAAFDKANFSLGSSITQSSLMSFFGRVNYEYDGKYLATVTARYDGSSRFAEGHKWGLFPSVALGWNITAEDFMADQQLFNLVKLRAGYGSVGNQNIPDYSFYSLYNASYSNGNVSWNSTGLRGTPNLTWEKQDQLNIGIDLGVLENRVQFTAEYFNINNSNLLMRRSLSPLTGYNQAIENIGEMTNKGLEFSVNALVVDAQDWKWNVTANLSKDKNKITKLYGNVDAIYNYGGFSGTEIQREGNFFLGQSLNTIYMLEFDRIIQESDMEYVNSLDLSGKTLKPGDILPKDQQPEGEEGHGVIDQNDKVIIGKKDPKFYGGFTSQVSWKGISLNAVFTYSYGAKAISGYYEGLMSGTGMSAAHEDMLDRWTPEHTNTTIPRATYDASIRYGAGETSWGIQDASFLRLASLTLAYDVPKPIINRVGITNLRIYTTGNNLTTWTKYKGYDPENGDWYPTARMFVLGLNLGF